MSTHLIKDMPHLRKKLARIDGQRLERIREARDSRNFKQMLKLWAQDRDNKTKVLDDKQRMAIYLMTDFVHNFSNKYICTRLGIAEHTFYTWRNDPVFLRYLDKEITRRKSFIRIHAFRNVHRAVLRGDMKATWNYLKMSGDLAEKHEYEDKTGERELNDAELNEEIGRLTQLLTTTHNPSGN